MIHANFASVSPQASDYMFTKKSLFVRVLGKETVIFNWFYFCQDECASMTSYFLIFSKNKL